MIAGLLCSSCNLGPIISIDIWHIIQVDPPHGSVTVQFISFDETPKIKGALPPSIEPSIVNREAISAERQGRAVVAGKLPHYFLLSRNRVAKQAVAA